MTPIVIAVSPGSTAHASSARMSVRGECAG